MQDTGCSIRGNMGMEYYVPFSFLLTNLGYYHKLKSYENRRIENQIS